MSYTSVLGFAFPCVSLTKPAAGSISATLHTVVLNRGTVFKDKKHEWTHYSDVPIGYPFSILPGYRDGNKFSSTPSKIDGII